jgi:hypothetical protein
VRWMKKTAVLRSYGVHFRDHPLVAARYVLIDPEIDNFTYELDNEEDLAAFVAGVTNTTERKSRELIAEVKRDTRLAAELQGRARWRPDFKRRLAFGRRLGWYSIARALKPNVVVEAGIKDGLGSALLLEAIQRNQAEGFPGTVISFDLSPDRGWLVSDRLRPSWEPVFESTYHALERVLRDRRVEMIIHDSEPTYACERFEFECALRHAGSFCAMLSNANWTTALRDLCTERLIPYSEFVERPRDHFYPGAAVGFALWRG